MSVSDGRHVISLWREQTEQCPIWNRSQFWGYEFERLFLTPVVTVGGSGQFVGEQTEQCALCNLSHCKANETELLSDSGQFVEVANRTVSNGQG